MNGRADPRARAVARGLLILVLGAALAAVAGLTAGRMSRLDPLADLARPADARPLRTPAPPPEPSLAETYRYGVPDYVIGADNLPRPELPAPADADLPPDEPAPPDAADPEPGETP